MNCFVTPLPHLWARGWHIDVLYCIMTLGYSNPDEGVQQSVMYGKQNDAGKQKGESHGMGNWIGIILFFGQWRCLEHCTVVYTPRSECKCVQYQVQMTPFTLYIYRFAHYTIYSNTRRTASITMQSNKKDHS